LPDVRDRIDPPMGYPWSGCSPGRANSRERTEQPVKSSEPKETCENHLLKPLDRGMTRP